MEKYYYQDPYKKEINTKITSITKNKELSLVQVETTIFYPEAGGQPGDKGTLTVGDKLFSILDSQKDESKKHVLHLIKDEENILKIGDMVKVSLNWPYRYSYMQKHAAQHILSSIFYCSFGLSTLATHLGKEIVTIELDTNHFSLEDCYNVERKANQVILENKKIIYQEYEHSDAEKLNLRRKIKVLGKVRIVNIEGTDLIACGGILPATTSEIEVITYYGQEKIRGHVRTKWLVAEIATTARHKNQEVIDSLCANLSSQENELVSVINSLKDNFNKEKQLCKTSAELIAKIFVQNKIKEEVNVITLSEEYTFISLKIFTEALKDFEKSVLLFQKNEGKTQWLVYLAKENNKDFRKTVLIPSAIKGGGRFPFFQGIVASKDVETFSTNFKNYFKDI